MAGSKVLQSFLLISLMIFSTHALKEALKVFLTDGKSPSRFEFETEIDHRVDPHRMIVHNYLHEYDTYTVPIATAKVIVFINYKNILETSVLRSICAGRRLKLAEDLEKYHYRLFYLGVSDFRDGDERLVGEFLLQTFQGRGHFEINTIGGDRLDRIYETSLGNLTKYDFNRDVLEWNVEGRIMDLHF